jgi:hypothetical protein
MARATSETVFEVYQPVGLDDGIAIVSVPFVEYAGTAAGGVEVGWTCRDNAIKSRDGETHNFNVANAIGLSVQVRRNRENYPLGLYGDTLRVVLDLSALPDTTRFWGHPLNSIVKATFECILANGRRAPGAKYLDISLIGGGEYGGARVRGCVKS